MRGLMRFLLVCLAWWPAVQAQSNGMDAGALAALSQLPPCALGCLKAAVDRSACEMTDMPCVCADVKLQSAVESCVLASCTLKQALHTKNVTATSCGAPIRDRRDSYNTISITLGVLSGFFMLLRIFTKLVILKTDLGADDWTIIATVLNGTPSSVLNIHGLTANGLGTDVWTVPFDNITAFVRSFFVMEILYFSQITLLKLSLLFFYLRIFPGTNVRRLLWGTVVFNCLFGASFVVAAIFQCSPIPYYWLRWDGEHKGTCIDINALSWSNAGISIGLDVFMLVVPLWQLSGLKMHWKKKLGVGAMFLVGTFVTVVSILRLQALASFAVTQNPTWDNWAVANWSTIEINVGIICACMPSLRLLLVKFFPKVVGSSSYAGTGGPNSRAQYYMSGNGKDMPSQSYGTSNHSKAVRSPTSSKSSDSKAGGITFTKTYAVEYHGDDYDEANLVRMEPLNKQHKIDTARVQRALEIRGAGVDLSSENHRRRPWGDR